MEENWIVNSEEEWEVTELEPGEFQAEYVFLDGSQVDLTNREPSRGKIFISYLVMDGLEPVESEILKNTVDVSATQDINDKMTRGERIIAEDLAHEEDNRVVFFDGIRPPTWGERGEFPFVSLIKDSATNRHYKGKGLIPELTDKYSNPVMIENIYQEDSIPDNISRTGQEVIFVKFTPLTPAFKIVYGGGIDDIQAHLEGLMRYCRNRFKPGYPLPSYIVHKTAGKNPEAQAHRNNTILPENSHDAYMKLLRG